MALKVEKVMKTAEKLVRKGKLEAAIKEYRKILAENPNDANTLNRVGDLYVRIERFDEAIKLFSQIAEQYANDGFNVKAIAIYKKIIKIDPTALKVYERLAELYYLQGLINEARTQFQVLADYYTKHENATSAASIYQRMSEIDPENPSHLLKLAELYQGQSLFDKAIRAYRQLADLFVVNGAVDEAVAVYRKALDLSTGDPAFVREAIQGLIDGGHREAAGRLIERALELNPENEAAAREWGFLKPEPVPEPPAPEPPPPEPEPDVFEIEAESFDEVELEEPDAFEIEAESFGEIELEEEIDLDEIELEVDEAGPEGEEDFVFNFDDETSDETGVSFAEEPSSQVAPPTEMPPVDLEKAAEGDAFKLEASDETDFTAFWESDEPASSQVLPPPDLENAASGGTDEFEIEMDLEGDDLGDEMDWEDTQSEVSPPAEEEEEAPLDPAQSAQRCEDLLAEAKVFSKYGLQPKSRSRLSDLFEISPDHVEATALLASLELEDGNHDEARKLGEKVARSASTESEKAAWEELNTLLARAGVIIAAAPAPAAAPAAQEPTRIAQLLDDLDQHSSGTMQAIQPQESLEDSALDFDFGEEDEDEPVAAEPVVAEPVAAEPVAAEPVAAEPAPAPPPPPAPAPPAAPEGGGLVDLDFSNLLDDEDDDDAPIPAAPPPPPPAPAAAPSAGGGMFDLAGELGLGDEDEDAVPAPAAPTPDETGMSWLDDVADEPEESPHESLFDDEDDFFNLAQELEGDLQEDDDIVLETAQEQSLEEIIEGFKQGVAENLSAEDYDTHFNLGIAYREMGLLDEAIGEFQLAAKDPRYMVECSSMLGICFLEKGLPELAIRWYQKGLAVPDLGEQQTLGLLYDMGDAYLGMGDHQAAYKTFVEIYGINTNYRDIGEKLQQASAGGQ